MSTQVIRHLALASTLAFLTLVVGAGCTGTSAADAGGAAAMADGNEQADPWQTDTTYSPTGTTLIPTGSDGGYEVVDEICGSPDDANYADRFLTPMFRDMKIVGDTAYVVDGSHLWTVDTGKGLCGEREGLSTLIGHPVALHVTPQRLWVAAIDGGLRGYAIGPDGAVDTSDVEVALSGSDIRVMDVTGDDNTLYAAMGNDGLAVVQLDEEGRVADATLLEAGPYANSVSIAEGRVLVAACDRVWTYLITDLETEDAGEQLVADANFAVPFGQAKGAIGQDDVVFVSVGSGLLGFRLDTVTEYLGYYTDDAPGFYVNEAEISNGFLYLAAGDESVRAIELGDLTLAEGTPVTWDEPAADTDAAVTMEMSDVTVEVTQIANHDPIAIEVDGDRLFALGNFRYVGERTLEVFDISIPAWLRYVCSFVQPNVGVDISQMGDDVVVHGSDGEHRVVAVVGGQDVPVGKFGFDPVLNGTKSEGDDLYLYGTGAVVRAGEDGQGGFVVEDLVPAAVDAQGLALDADNAYIADAFSDGILVMSMDDHKLVGMVSAKDGFLGDTELATYGDDLLLAYDRVLGEVRVFDTTKAALPVEVGRTNVGLCEAYKLADLYSGAVNAKAHFVTRGDALHMVCPRQIDGTAALLNIAIAEDGTPSLTSRIGLPALVFSDAEVVGDSLVLSSFDNNRYQSTLLSCDLETGELEHETTFTGHANAVLHADGRVFVIDGDFGLRVFDTELNQELVEPLSF